MNHSRRHFMKKAGVIGAVTLTGLNPIFGSNEGSKRPNIIWILAEDISVDLACYGTAAVQTPNLDKLAENGLLYENAFATSPVCSPARSSLLTGMYQTSIGAHHHRTKQKKPLKSPVKPVTAFLKEHGYFTALGCGYWKKTDLNFEEQGLFEGTDWNERKPGQPFFAQITLGVTHRPFNRDEKNPIDPQKVKIPPYYPDTGIVRRDWARYLETIQIMDRQFGQIAARLGAEGLLDNTVIIFVGDNGRCHLRAKQWLYDAGIHVPLIISWPDHLPSGKRQKELVSTIDITATTLKLAGIDIPDYMQGQPLLGKDKHYRNAVFAARDRCDANPDRIRCVRTDRYKYIKNFRPELPYTQFSHYKEFFYPAIHVLRYLADKGDLTEAQAAFLQERKPPEELYDIVNDPYEVSNLAGNPEHSEILKDLRTKLENWIQTTNDMGRTDEDPAELKAARQEMETIYTPLWEKRGIYPHAAPAVHLCWWKQQFGIDVHVNGG